MSNLILNFRHLTRDVRLYIVAFGCIAFGYFGVLGVLFNLYLVRLGYGPEVIGLLVGGGQLIWGISALPAGMVGARIGSRDGILWGMRIMAVTMLLLMCAEFLPASMKIQWITLFWMGAWIGSALLIVNGTPYLMEVSALENRRSAFALQQAAMGLFGFAGSLAAGVLPANIAGISGLGLESPTVYWVALWLTPLAYCVGLVVMQRTQPLPAIVQVERSGYEAKMPWVLFGFIGLLVFLQTTGEGSVRAFFNVYLDTTLAVPITQIGIVMGIGQFLPILSSLAAPLLMERLGNARTMMLAGVMAALFMLVLAYFTNWMAASLGYIGFLLVLPIGGIARNLFSQEIVAVHWRTTMSAVFTMGIALGWSSAAGLGGYLITGFGYTALFIIGAVTAATAVVILWIYLHTRLKGGATSTIGAAP